MCTTNFCPLLDNRYRSAKPYIRGKGLPLAYNKTERSYR